MPQFLIKTLPSLKIYDWNNRSENFINGSIFTFNDIAGCLKFKAKNNSCD